MTLRKIHLSDISQLILIEEATQLAPWTDEAFRRCLLAGSLGWVLEQEDKIMGFIITTLQAGESHILNLCIDVPYQRKGLGRQLLTHALAEVISRGAAIAYLEVRRSNAKAISLYVQSGFVQIGERKSYYPTLDGREDALVFAKDLTVS